MLKNRAFRVAGFVLAALTIAPVALANSDQIILYNNRYPTTAGQANQGSNCNVCHASTPALNAFGLAFKNSPAGPDSTNGFAQIEFVDSDGDNFTNLHEILKFTYPGNNAAFPANANTAPVLNAIGNKTLNEGQTLTFQVTTTDDVTGLAPLLSVSNLPPGATFVDNRDRTGTFNWVTDFTDGGSYPGIQFTANDGLLTDTETISITVSDINEAPEMDIVRNQLAYVGQSLQFDVSATDPENAALTLSATGLPAGVSFVDNGDGTATITWGPAEGDIGTYPNVTFTAEDDATQTDSATIALFVTAVPKLYFSDETPLNTTNAADDVLDYAADLATDGEGNWVAVWYISDDGVVAAQRSSDNGKTWSAPTQVGPSGGADEAPQIATDAAGNWVVVWRSSNNLGNTIGDDPDILYARSTNNGETWTDAAPLNPEAGSDGNANNRGANIETDGSVWVATWITASSLYLTRSEDAGQTWETPIYVGEAYVESFPDTAAARIAGDGTGNWIVVWSEGIPFVGAPNDIDVQIVRSFDDAKSWTPNVDLNSNAGIDFGDDILPSIATDRAGTWIAVWRSTDSLGATIGTDSDILMSRSTNNGSTWSAPAPVAMDAAYDSFSWDYTPSIATDGLGTWVSMWHADGALIRACYSTDNGTTWSFPEVQNLLHDDTTRLPQAVPDGKGSWLAVWETNENPSDSGFDFDLMLATAYAPNVVSITRDGDTLSNADSVDFTVTFDNEVFGVDTGDFGVSTNKILTGPSVASVVKLSPTEYTVSVATGTGTGTLVLDFVDDDTVFATSGNVAGGPGEGNGDAQSVDAYTIDKTRPVIELVGEPIVEITLGTSYSDEGATASDDLDGQLAPVLTGTVDTATEGSYILQYNVSDNAGNAAIEVTRTVNVSALPEGEGIPEGIAEGVIEGIAEGVVEGVAEGVVEGVAEGIAEGVVEGEGEGAEPSLYEQLLYTFASAETSGDNLLTLGEIQQQLPAFSQVELDAADANGDGRLSVAELLEQTGGGILMSADTNGDFVISLSELIRLIQLYNANRYACAPNAGATEDGYEPRVPDGNDPDCVLSSIDRNRDNALSLSELLRAIQFYSLGGYSYCAELSPEDGFCE